ncbi:class I SAM-dependent methyltransferase [Candidatus Woesearchaeota archaeon]|nr:class I SAM-dependent methyltransferase [Candidatus Woesearchaeota archaeon]
MVTTYTPQTAKAYQQTAEISIPEMDAALTIARGMFGNLEGKLILDFGCGTGRSSRLLHQWGAYRVLGIERNRQMLAIAESLPSPGIEYYHAGDARLWEYSEHCAAAFTSFVLMEVPTREELAEIHNTIARILLPGSVYVAITNNADALPYESEHISIRPVTGFTGKSGDQFLDRIKGEHQFEFIDHYWTRQDYNDILRNSGFSIEEMVAPKNAKGEEFPYLAIKAVKL